MRKNAEVTIAKQACLKTLNALKISRENQPMLGLDGKMISSAAYSASMYTEATANHSAPQLHVHTVTTEYRFDEAWWRQIMARQIMTVTV